MPYSRRMGYRAERSNAWSNSKYTNQNKFDPQGIESSRALDQNYEQIFSGKGLFIKEFPCNPAFLMPLNVEEVREALEVVPKIYLRGLNAVLILGGSAKQLQTFKGCSTYGFYYPFYRTIILNPFPRKFMTRRFKKPLKPSSLREYERAGAIIKQNKKGQLITLTAAALKTFYRRDVLIHEIGHHVDRLNFRSKKVQKQEGFAEWFATHYGFNYQR